jgi:hypothetical protein
MTKKCSYPELRIILPEQCADNVRAVGAFARFYIIKAGSYSAGGGLWCFDVYFLREAQKINIKTPQNPPA